LAAAQLRSGFTTGRISEPVAPRSRRQAPKKAYSYPRAGSIDGVRELASGSHVFASRGDDDYNPDGIANLLIENGIWEGERYGHMSVAIRSGRFFRAFQAK
jgi:hypothetical protein